MSIDTSWTIKIGTVASPTDFTSRVMGLQIDQNVDVNVIGRGVARITLLNRDGALTPGGGGTYGTTDWFAQGVFISTTITSTSTVTKQVFHGVVTDFDLQDDGVFSTVTITALDGWTLGGRSVPPAVPSFSNIDYDTLVTVAFQQTTYGTLYYPLLGGTNANAVPVRYSVANPDVINDTTSLSYASFADLWQSSVIPTANAVMWATKVEASGSNTYYYGRYLASTNTFDTSDRHDYEFDPPGSLSGSKLPFDYDTFRQEFNNDTLITQVQVKGNYSGATTNTTNSGTQGSYGSRTAAYTNTFIRNATDVQTMATRLTNRYGTSRFTPAELRTSATLIKRLAASAAHSKWASLLSIEEGIWQRVKITWTGSGASSQTAYCVVKGRRISVTPEDTVVTLSLGNWADNHAFILDLDQLDVDRLG